jgi:16S rRNA (adenine1518-N6/adenine1519-N6)-dimethyltransferase
MTRQRLGQHFLSDVGWREAIARSIGIAGPLPVIRDDVAEPRCWIEIGAGHGEMTRYLARTGKPVYAIELDPLLARRLQGLAAEFSNVSVLHSDALKTDLAEIAAGRPVCVYGNLPYYITSPILHHIFASRAQIAWLHVVIQLEVARRMVARPGTRDYGYLSVLSQYFCQPELALEIPPEAFKPPPEVASALVSAVLPGASQELGVKDANAFLDFVKLCFAQKRKTLVNNLRSVATPARVRDVLASMGLPSVTRAEEMSVGELAELFAAINAARNKGKAGGG